METCRSCDFASRSCRTSKEERYSGLFDLVCLVMIIFGIPRVVNQTSTRRLARQQLAKDVLGGAEGKDACSIPCIKAEDIERPAKL